MTELKQRKLELGIDNILIRDSRVSFKVEKTLKPDPNTAEITIYNLTDAQRDHISAVASPIVRLSAGYEDGTTQIFYGQLIHCTHEINGPDIITTLSTGDGIEEYRKKRIRMSIGPKTKADVVFKALITALGLKKGNTEKFVTRFKTGVKAQIFLSGAAFSGSASFELTQLCKSAGLSWSIQDGALQIVDQNTATEKFAIKLTPTTGLVSSPSISNKGIATGKCLIIPDMYPGRQIEIDSRFLKGRFRLEKVSFTGDTHGSDWYCEFEAKNRIKAA